MTIHPVPKPPRAPAKERKPLAKVSAKRLAANGGKPALKRGKIKPYNAKRKAKEWTRAYGSEARVAFVASLPCVACGQHRVPNENAHTSGDGGAGRKASAKYVIPLCHDCHAMQHAIGAGTFALRYSLDLRELAAETDRAWSAHLAALGGNLESR
jgi:hypothetical protein